MLSDTQKHVMRGQTVFTEAQVQRRIERALASQPVKTPSKREMYAMVLEQLGITEMNSPSTPSSNWLAEGTEDPVGHHKLIDQERGQLMLGKWTDDELANAIFLYGNPSDYEKTKRLLSGEISDIAFLTAGKERIRWLSRHLELALKKVREQAALIHELENPPNVVGDYHEE